MRRGTVVDGVYAGVEGQGSRIVNGDNAVRYAARAERQHEVCRRADAVMGNGVGEALRAAYHRGAGVGEVIGVAAVAVNGQRTVLPLYDRAVSVHAGGDPQRVGDGGDRRACRGVVAPRGGVGIEDHVAVQAGVARDGARAGLFHRHVEAGVRAGGQQVGVIAQHAIVTVSQPGEVQRYAGGPQCQQVGELRLAGIDHRGPGAVNAVETLHHQLKGVEQREHGAGGVGIHHDVGTAAAAYREVHLSGVIPQQRQDIAHRTHQQEAVIAVLAVGDGGGGAEIQLFDVIAGGERHHWREG